MHDIYTPDLNRQQDNQHDNKNLYSQLLVQHQVMKQDSCCQSNKQNEIDVVIDFIELVSDSLLLDVMLYSEDIKSENPLLSH